MINQLQTKLQHLVGLIESYQVILKAKKNRTKKEVAVFKELKYLRKVVKQHVRQQAKTNTRQQEENCQIKFIQLKPNQTTGAQLQTAVQIRFSTKDCQLAKTSIELIYKGKIDRKETIERDINATEYIANIPLPTIQFRGDETSLVVNLLEQQLLLTYKKPQGVNLSSATAAQQTVNNYQWYCQNQYLLGKEVTGVKVAAEEFYPSYNIIRQENGNDMVSYANLAIAIKGQTIPNTITLAATDEELQKQELDELYKKYCRLSEMLFPLQTRLGETVAIFRGLEGNYVGKDKAKIFGATYKTRVQEGEKLLQVIANQYKAVEDYKQQIIAEKDRLFPPPPKEETPEEIAKREAEEKITAQLESIQQQLSPLEESLLALQQRLIDYENHQWSYQQWKAELEEVQPLIAKIPTQQQTLTTITSTLEALDSDKLSNKNVSLKGTLVVQSNELVQVAKRIADSPQYAAKKEGMQQAGDGLLEWVSDEAENNYSQAEKEKYQLTGRDLIFKDPQKDLFDANGADLEDIKQGAVGDCYFLSALANLANEKDEHLLQEMIEEVGDKYIVTLHQNGIPVQIEVDKKLMYRQLQEGTELVGGGNDSDYIAAKPIGDSWVAIIEKAYAKMVSDGDYTQGSMKAGRAEDAMKVLLGNKVKEPKALYLTTAGELVLEPTADSKEFLNPLHMDKVTPTELQQIIQSAYHKGYKMNVASPQSYQGGTTLTDSHLLNIGEDLYMTFKHGYTLYEAEEKTAWLFNPHGKTKDKEYPIFDATIKSKFQNWTKIEKELEQAVELGRLSEELRSKVTEELAVLAKIDLLNEQVKDVQVEWNNSTVKKFKVSRLKKTLDKIRLIFTAKLKEGFVQKLIKVEEEQNIPYSTLQKYFDYVVFTIIK